MQDSPDDRLPPAGSGNTRVRWALYSFYVALGLAGAAKLVEGGESVLGFCGSIAFVVGGVISALALIYGAMTGRLP